MLLASEIAVRGLQWSTFWLLQMSLGFVVLGFGSEGFFSILLPYADYVQESRSPYLLAAISCAFSLGSGVLASAITVKVFLDHESVPER